MFPFKGGTVFIFFVLTPFVFSFCRSVSIEKHGDDNKTEEYDTECDESDEHGKEPAVHSQHGTRFSGWGRRGEGRARGLTVLTTTGRQVSVFLVTWSHAVIHGMYVHCGCIVDMVVNGERRLPVGSGSHVVQPVLGGTVRRRLSTDDIQGFRVRAWHLDVFAGIVHSVGISLAHVVVHRIDDFSRIRRIRDVRQFHRHFEEIRLHGITGEIAEEIEEVVVTWGTSKQQLLGYAHVLLKRPQLS